MGIVSAEQNTGWSGKIDQGLRAVCLINNLIKINSLKVWAWQFRDTFPEISLLEEQVHALRNIGQITHITHHGPMSKSPGLWLLGKIAKMPGRAGLDR